ncbi:MAG TPA: flagellar filament capping protein FliD [Bryobacteraceae bacterium]|jgi:flagellar hook-associated protein 2|nr:flagellar filament capping protein FliD [Bryobacteraceae bacterium]
MSTIPTTPLYFTGVSTYSSDFQSIIQRQVAIAKLPVQKLQNEQADNLNKKQALIALDPSVATLGSAIAALGALASSQGVSASSSDSTLVSVVNTGAPSPATYTISNVTSLAAPASETSNLSYSDPLATPVSNSGHVNLVVGASTYNLDLTANNNLAGLRDAINNAGAGVSASILTAGTSNYLSVNANNPGATTLQLNDVPLDLVTSTGTGTETSNKTYADSTTVSVSVNNHVDLVAGSTTYHLDLTGNNNLTGLMNAINGAGAAGVSASITGSAGAYSLSLSGSPGTLQLNDLPSQVDLISNTNQGSNASFTLNNTINITRSTNTVNDLISGLSFTLLAKTAGPVTLSLATDRNQLSTALQTFATNYNSVVDQLNQQVGLAAGPLAGDLLIQSISSDLQQVASYWNTGSGSIHSLSDLGVTFDTTGHLGFNQTTFDAVSDSQIPDAFKFLGSSKSGLGALANNFTQLSDPLTGMIRVQEDGYDTTDKELTSQISSLNDRASQVQASLTAKLQAADALVAELQAQQNSVNAAVSSLNFVLYGKLSNANGL